MKNFNTDIETIAKMSDEEIMALAMERPGHPGQYGFMFSPKQFRSEEDFAATMYELMQRLGKVENLKAKMQQLRSTEIAEASPDEDAFIAAIARSFLEAGRTGHPPKIVVFTGGTGAGKTTIRKKDFAEDYVQFEFGDVATAVKRGLDAGTDTDTIERVANRACERILQEAIGSHMNIATEIIGEDEAFVKSLVDAMVDIGYKVEIRYVYCEVVEAYRRHLRAVEEDPDYLSAYFTQEATVGHLLRQAKQANETPKNG